jgi:hypothetical protein
MECDAAKEILSLFFFPCHVPLFVFVKISQQESAATRRVDLAASRHLRATKIMGSQTKLTMHGQNGVCFSSKSLEVCSNYTP